MIGLFLVLLLGIATTDADTHCLWSFTPSVCLFDIVDKWVSISQFLCSLCLGHDHFTQGNYLYIFFFVLVYFSVWFHWSSSVDVCISACLPFSELCVVVCVYRCQSLASLPFSRGSVSDPDELCCFSKELDWLKINPLVFTLLTGTLLGVQGITEICWQISPQ